MSCCHCPNFFLPTFLWIFIYLFNKNDIGEDKFTLTFERLAIHTWVDINKVLHAEVWKATANTVPGPHCRLQKTQKWWEEALRLWFCVIFECLDTSSSGEMRICPSSRTQLLMSHSGTSWGWAQCSLGRVLVVGPAEVASAVSPTHRHTRVYTHTQRHTMKLCLSTRLQTVRRILRKHNCRLPPNCFENYGTVALMSLHTCLVRPLFNWIHLIVLLLFEHTQGPTVDILLGS